MSCFARCRWAGYVSGLFCRFPRNFERIKSKHVSYHAATLDLHRYNASAEPASFSGKQICDTIFELHSSFSRANPHGDFFQSQYRILETANVRNIYHDICMTDERNEVTDISEIETCETEIFRIEMARILKDENCSYIKL